MAAAIAALAIAGTATWSAFSSGTANAGSYFATASSFGASCSNNVSTPIYLTGVENGRVSNLGSMSWSTVSGAVSPDSTVSRTGAYSLRAAPAGAAAYVQKLLVTVSVSYPTTAVARFAVRLDSPPSADAELFRFITQSTGGGSVMLRYIAATQKLAMSIRGTSGGTPTVVESSGTVGAGTWYVIDVKYGVAGATHTVDWRVNGTAQTQGTAAGAADTVANALFGTGSAATYTARYDDIMITGAGTDYPLGPGGVHLLKPNGMGTSVNPGHFSEDDGTAIDANTWTRLDDVPGTSTTDYIRQTTASGGYVELTYENTAHTCIRGVWGRVHFHYAGTNQTNWVKASMFDGTRESVIKDGNWNDNVDTFSRQTTDVVKPLNAPWTQAAVNGLVGRFGFATDVSPPPMLDALLLEYEVQQ
ncbi:MAG TPA: hypothetical protein VHF89_12510 [Solirubrobacteraceae bacterium]|nr:hypothetical protein [Solirubrobacteraceae bacterium]